MFIIPIIALLLLGLFVLVLLSRPAKTRDTRNTPATTDTVAQETGSTESADVNHVTLEWESPQWNRNTLIPRSDLPDDDAIWGNPYMQEGKIPIPRTSAEPEKPTESGQGQP
jgi:hypothetical protein